MRKILWLTILLAQVGSTEAKDQWLESRSDHFRIFGNSGKGRVQDTLFQLEKLRLVISEILPHQNLESPIPTEIYVFKNEKSFRAFQPLRDGKPENWIAVFRPSRYRNVIAMVFGRSAEKARELSFQQYIHLILSYDPARYPVWYGEGLSEFFGNFSIRKNEAHLGKMYDRHRRTLSEYPFLSLEDLFAVTRESPYYRDAVKRTIFDAHAWAFMHYLIIGKSPEGARQLTRFVQLVHEGKNHTLAFHEAFQMSPSDMNGEMHDYMTRRIYQYIRFEVDTTDVEKDYPVRPLDDSAVNRHLGNLLFSVRRLDDAEEYLQTALEMEPRSPETHESLGFLCLQRQQREEALQHLTEAVRWGSKNPITHYEYARALLHEYLGARSVRSIPDDIAEPAKVSLELSINQAPRLTDAARLLAFVYLVRDENIDQGIDRVEKALSLDPGKPRLLFMLGQLRARKEDYQEARSIFQKLLGSADDPNFVAAVRYQLDSLEARMSRGGPSMETNRSSQDASTDLREVTGNLVRIDCHGEGGPFYVVMSEALRLVLRSLERTAILNPSGTPIEKPLGCGPQNRTVRVLFHSNEPLDGIPEETEIQGELVSLQLLK